MTSRVFFSRKILFSLMVGVILLFIGTMDNQHVSAQTTANPTPIASESLAEHLGFTAPILDELQQ